MVELPPEAGSLADAWGFDPTEEIEGGYCSRIFADSTRVLKVPWRGEEAVAGWKMAVAISGAGAPTVHRYDEATGALLMDRIVPGTMLRDFLMTDDEAMDRVLSFLPAIRRTPPDGLIPVERYFSNPSPLARRLLETQTDRVPLHGDLHHENILLSAHGWLAIDPKGLWGDPAMEAAAFLRNPWPALKDAPDLKGLLHHRIARLARELDCDPWRIWGWGLLELEDGRPGDPWFPIAEALRSAEPA